MKILSLKNPIVLFCGIALLISAVYANTLGNGFVFDDHSLVIQNETIHDIKNIPRLLGLNQVKLKYRALRTASYAIDWAMSGGKPWSFHLANIFYHIITAGLLFSLTMALFKNRLLAVIATLIFALHPVQADSVAYISGRRDILFTLFYLAAFRVYLAYREKPAWWRILCILGLFACSLSSKEMGITLPAIFLLYEAFMSQKRGSLIAAVKRQKVFFTSFLVLGTIFLLVTFIQHKPSHRSEWYAGGMIPHSFTMLRVLVYYLWLLLVPLRLIADYSFAAFSYSQHLFEPALLASIAILGILGWYLFRGWRARSVYAFFGLWFFITLLPVMQIIPHHEIMAEHYLYLPLIGFAWALGKFFSDVMAERSHRWVVGSIVILLIAGYSVRTIIRNQDWHDAIRLQEVTVAQVPRCARAHHNLGTAYRMARRFDEAVREYMTTLVIDPEYAGAQFCLAVTYQQQGKILKALDAYKKTTELSPDNEEAWSNLGLLLLQTGNIRQAQYALEQSTARNPEKAESFINLGIIYASQKRFDDAIAAFRHALALDKKLSMAAFNCGVIYYQQQKFIQAQSVLETIPPTAPEFARAQPLLKRIAAEMQRMGL